MKLPHRVVYTDNIKYGGEQFMYTISIKHENKNDKGLYTHEYQHIKQWYLATIIFVVFILLLVLLTNYWLLLMLPFSLYAHNLLYKLSNYYRYKCELDAHIAQLKVDGFTDSNVDWVVDSIVNFYDLNVSESDVRRSIMERKVL